ncbi:MAG TPA: GNAT family N-acetyltransferase [Planctomycetota bacterium]|nr:GNAT family N-acetyltransferase [Planctomycetota bacterium]
MDAAPKYRKLTKSDIPGAQLLREFAKWNQTDTDWENLLALEPNGCFAAEMDGKIVGTATSTRFIPNSGPRSFGWIGMVLVHPDYRRHGIGSTLLKQCIAYLKDSGVQTVKLDATPMGRLVYEKLGFVAEYELERWEGVAKFEVRSPKCEVAPMGESDLADVGEYDTPIFGAQRETLISLWRKALPEGALVARLGGKVVGYTLARGGMNFDQIGPVIGDDQAICEALFARAIHAIGPKKIIVDVVSSQAWTIELAKKAGLTHQRPFLRMAFGPNSSPGKPVKTFAICCPELG